MDRVINYVAEQPQTLEILRSNKFGLFGQGYAERSMIGLNMQVEGFACTPTIPTADLNIHVGVGSIYFTSPSDATAYSDLGTDTTVIVKQGLLAAPLTFAITPPAGGGNSQVFLVQATLTEADGGSTVLQYYSGNITPLLGPGNSGTPQNTRRTVVATVTVKNGTIAATGSQVTPAADAGNVPLWAVTVANGATQITGANIVVVPAAPYFPTLPQIPPAVQISDWTYAVDIGAVNALAVTSVGNIGIWPPVTALVAGLLVFIKVGHTNTGASTFNLEGLGAVAIHRATGAALSAGDLTLGEIVALVYDGAAWQVVNYIGPLASTQTNTYATYTIAYGTDHGTPNAIVCELSYAVTLAAGLVILVKVANANTGPTTINAANLGVVTIKENNKDLAPFGVVPGELIVLCYDGTFFQKMPRRWPYFFFDAGSLPAPINMAVGDQVVETFTNVTAIPLNIACAQGVYDIELVVTANSSIDTDCYLQPNNVTSGNGKSWKLLTGTGGSNNANASSDNAAPFIMPLLDGSGVGPFLLRLTAATSTRNKQVRWLSGIAGGVGTGVGAWSDTTTLWSLLGTLVVFARGQNYPDLATVSGVVITRRLA